MLMSKSIANIAPALAKFQGMVQKWADYRMGNKVGYNRYD